MTHYINRRPSAFIGLVTLIVLLVGAFFIAKAMESKGVEAERTTTLQTEFLVNKDTEFEPRDSANPLENCDTEDSKHCVYQLTSDGMNNIPEKSSYTPADIEDYEAKGWIEPHPESGLGIYLN